MPSQKQQLLYLISINHLVTEELLGIVQYLKYWQNDTLMALICPLYFNFPFIILFSVWTASEVTSFGADWEAMMHKRSHRWGQIQSLSAYTRCLLPALFATALPSSASWPAARAVLEGDLWARHPFEQHWDRLLCCVLSGSSMESLKTISEPTPYPRRRG